MLTTRFTDLVGCRLPIQQAGMGLATPELAAAVSNAGGLGMLCAARAGAGSLNMLEQLMAQTEALTERPFGVNFLIPPHLLEYLETGCFGLAARRARLVEFFWSWPDPHLVAEVHAEDALVSWQVGSLEEALAAEQAGVDLIVAQGIGAGGHVRGTISLLPLLDEVLDAVNVPVLAAGGIGTGRGLAAVLAAGADGVRMGTRFVAAAEADTHPRYVDLLIAASGEGTVFGRDFITGWDAPGRVLRSAVDAARSMTEEVVGEASILGGGRYPLHRFAPDVVTRGVTGTIEAMSLWAGESVGAVTRVQPAADIVREVSKEAEALLTHWTNR